MSDIPNNKPAFERSTETDLLVTILTEYSREVTYAALSDRVGFFVDGSSSALTSARRILEREQQIVFEPIPKIGLIRLTDPEKGKTMIRKNRKAEKAAGRVIKRFEAIENFTAMSLTDQTLALLQRTKAEAARQMFRTKQHKKTDTIKSTNSINDLLSQFKSLIRK